MRAAILAVSAVACAVAPAFGSDVRGPDNDNLALLVMCRAEMLHGTMVHVGFRGAPRGKLVSADERGITLESSGNSQLVPWGAIRADRLASLALRTAQDADECMMIAMTAAERRLPAAVESALERMLSFDATRSAEVEGLRRQLLPKKTVARRSVVKKEKRASGRTGSSTPAPPLAWKNVGPGGGGAMYTPTISPLDPKLGIITCDMGGSYLTSDGGRHWNVIPGKRHAHGVAFSYHDPNTIYLGANDRLYRSPDRGVTWLGVTPDRQYPTNSVWDVVCDPEDPRCVWASFGRALEAGLDVNDGNRLMVEFSINGGQSFTDGSEGLPDGSGLVTKLAVDPGSPRGRRTLYAATTSGFYRSRDGGKSWERPAAKGLGARALWHAIVLYDPDDEKSTLLVSGKPNGIWRSADGGDSFEPSGAGLDGGGAGADFMVEAMAGAWNDPKVAYAIGTAVVKSTDGGRTWKRFYDDARKHAGWFCLFRPWSHDGGRGVGCNPVDANQVWFTSDMGYFASNDGGATITEMQSHPIPDGTRRHSFKTQLTRTPMNAPHHYDGGGLEVTYCYQVMPDPHNKNVFYAGYADIGTWRSEDAGTSWTYNAGIWNTGIVSAWRNSCYEIAPDPRKPGRLWGVFAGLHNLPSPDPGKAGRYHTGGVAVSDDGGRRWRPLSKAGVPDMACTSVMLDRRNGNVWVAAFSGGVFVSSDGGKSFHSVSEGLGAKPLCWRLKQTRDNSIFLACSYAKPGGLWRLDEAERRWVRCDVQVAFEDVRDIAVGGEGDGQKSLLAVAVSGGDGGVYASPDAGKTWQRLHSTSARTVAFSPDLKTWYAGGGRGLKRSFDGGATWQAVDDFPFGAITDATFDVHDPRRIWIGTSGCGVFKGRAIP